MTTNTTAIGIPWMPLRRLVSIRTSNVDKVRAEGEVPVRLCNYVDVYYNERISGELDLSYGSATRDEIRKFRLKGADVVITKDSETPDDIAVAALVEPSAEDVVCGYHLTILRPAHDRILGPYLFWALRAKPVREALGVRAQGVTRFGLTLDGIGSTVVPVPDLETQGAIAAYLDQEVARLDQLIAKKRKQVALLELRARQTVTELVTGQMAHGDRCVSTDLDDLATMPKHWALRRAGILFRQVAEANDDDLPILSVSIHHGISDRQLKDDDRDRKVNLIQDRSSYKRLRPGDLAYNMMRAWQGAVGVSSVDGAVSPAYVVARPTSEMYSPFYQFLLRTPPFIEQMRQRSKGITDFRLRLYWEHFRQILLPVPPLEEQRDIALRAAAILKEAERARTMIGTSISRLKERRYSLITEVITAGHPPRAIHR